MILRPRYFPILIIHIGMILFYWNCSFLQRHFEETQEYFWAVDLHNNMPVIPAKKRRNNLIFFF